MCDQTMIEYSDGEVVWVKLGPSWWPGEVVGFDKLPPDVLPSFRKPPIAVVKFFQEDTYEYVKNINNIYKYNCSKKNEFIKKGLDTHRRKGNNSKFLEDVVRAEKATDGDENILEHEDFQEKKKESWSTLFGDPKKTPAKKSRDSKSTESPNNATPRKFARGNSDYKAHILVQPSKAAEASEVSTPSTSRAGSETHDDKADKTPPTPPAPSTPAPCTPNNSSTGMYSCHACSFTSNRLNVMILHNKTHSVTYVPYTPSPVRKKPTVKTTPKTSKSTPSSTKTPKPRKPKTEKPEKSEKTEKPEKSDKSEKSEKSENKPKKAQGKKRSCEENTSTETKKVKTDQEIKTSLLADWDDGEEDNDDSKDESSFPPAVSPEIPVGLESPARPASNELESAQIPEETEKKDAKTDELGDKPESSSDAKYDFCEDEDWAIEADVGRKIPRIKNPKRKSDSKSLSMDEDDVAKEVAELLNSTTVPELPSAPEPLKAEENFPERPIAKSPDKLLEKTLDGTRIQDNKTSDSTSNKTIFKTKTFFRSRHSRSQDAIGKYIAEQLNAAERMNNSDCEINGSDAVSSPEARESPPAESVRVAKLAPKIQLKKMKAAEREKLVTEETNSEPNSNTINSLPESMETAEHDLGAIETNNDIDTDSILEEKPKKRTSFCEQSNLDLVSSKLSDNGNDELTPYVNTTHTNLVDDTSQSLNIANTESSTKPIIETASMADTVQQPVEPAAKVDLSESTASAVDALLSVSRDPDTMTKIVSDDPPDDLFEEDKTDVENNSTVQDNITESQPISNINNFSMDVEEPEYHNGNGKTENIVIESVSDETNVPVDGKQNDSAHIEGEEENVPSESDLQIAEALMNLPSRTTKTKTYEKTVDKSAKFDLNNKESNDNIVYDEPYIENTQEISADETVDNTRFETEEEKSENLNAARSLVQMSESINHDDKMDVDIDSKKEPANISEPALSSDNNNGINKAPVEEAVIPPPNGKPEINPAKQCKLETTSKLMKMLEEPLPPKTLSPLKTTQPVKHVVPKGKEKILNFDVSNPTRGKPQPPKQKIIIRRTTPSKNLINTLTEPPQERIILSPAKKSSQDGTAIQTYTIQASPDKPKDNNTIIIQQKVRKVSNPPPKLQKITPSQSLVITSENKKPISKPNEDILFDINSMPVILSDDIITPENIDKMPIVMSDGNIVTSPTTSQISPPIVVTTKKQVTPKIIKHKQAIIESDKTLLTHPKTEMKTLLVNSTSDTSKIITPNILSKSSKLRGAKPMVVIDKATGKQKIIMTKSEPAHKEQKQTVVAVQNNAQVAPKTEKFIILPTPSSPRPRTQTQKIVIDPQTGKAHVVLTKTPEPTGEVKPVSAKLVAGAGDAAGAGGTVMIITNAQGTQSRIVLTPEHEKILFPNKQQANITQIKAIPQRLVTNSVVAQKPQQTLIAVTQSPPKTHTKIVPKQKSAIITSKGQLIVGGNVVTAAQNIAPMPEVKPATTKRIITTTTVPKKVIQTVQKTNPEPLIFLQQKSGAVMQLTAAQFEHLQRTGQIVQQVPAPAVHTVHEIKPKPQKTITITSNETIMPVAQKQQRVRPAKAAHAPSPVKKAKQEIILKPVASPMPSLTPIVSKEVYRTPSVSNTVTVASTSSPYTDLDNIEELIPTNSIVREMSQPTPSLASTMMPPPPPPPPVPPAISPAAPAPPPPAPAEPTPELVQQPDAATIADNQLVAVPSEHFGCPPGVFYLCLEDNGTLTPIDNRPLVLENDQLVPMAEPPAVVATPPTASGRDILEAALASSDVFHSEAAVEAPDFRDLNANVSVHCRVSETSTTLHQPIMTPVEVPSNADGEPPLAGNLEDGLAGVIGVTPHVVPTSLELPITVTDPRIAPKTSDPLTHTTYSTTVIPTAAVAGVAGVAGVGAVGDVCYGLAAEGDGSMSMPLLTEEDEVVGKSMPILTEEALAAAVSLHTVHISTNDITNNS